MSLDSRIRILSVANLTLPWSRHRDFALSTLPLRSYKITCNSWTMLGILIDIVTGVGKNKASVLIQSKDLKYPVKEITMGT